MNSIRSKIIKGVKNSIISQDILGFPISLTYKKNQTYRSVIGGLFSMFVKFLVTIYLGYQISNVIQRCQTAINYSTFKRDLARDFTPITVNRNSFDFALQMNYDPLYDPEYSNSKSQIDYQSHIDEYFSLKFTAVQVILPSFSDEGNSSYSQIETDVPLQKCKRDALKKLNSGVTALLYDYYCPPENYSIPLMGSYSSQKTQLMRIEVLLCDQAILDKRNPGKKCKTQQESMRLMAFSHLRFPVAVDYFDAKEYDTNPIKTTSRTFIYTFSNKTSQIQYFKMSQNHAVLSDNMLSSFFTGDNITYNDLKLDYSSQYETNGSKSFFKLIFFADENIQTTERKAFTVVDAFSNTGGIMGALITVVRFLLGAFQKNLFIGSIMKKLFYFEDNDDRKNKQIKIKPINNHKNETQFIDKQTKKTSFERESWDEQKSNNELNSTGQNFIQNQNNQILILMNDYVRSLKRYRFHFKDYITYKIKGILRLLCKRSSLNFKEKIYNQGRQRVENEIDITRLIRAVRKIEILEYVILKSYERKLIPYLKNGILTDNTNTNNTQPLKQNSKLSDDQISQCLQKLVISKDNNGKFLKMFNKYQSLIDHKIELEIAEISHDDIGLSFMENKDSISNKQMEQLT